MMLCNNCLKFYETLILWTGMIFLALGRALVGDPPTPAAEGASYAAPVNWSKLTYSKIGDSIVDQIRDAIVGKSGATGATGWLLLVITRRINLRTNRLEASIADLVKASGLTRQTIITHVSILEGMGYITVDRAAISTSRNAVNVFHLAGGMASMALINFSESKNWTPSENDFAGGVQKLDRKENNNITGQHAAAAAVEEHQPAESGVDDSESANVPGEDSFDGDPAYEALAALGIEQSLARHLAAVHAPARIGSVITRSRHEKIRVPAAFVVQALTRNWTWDEPHAAAPKSAPRVQQGDDWLARMKNSQYARFLDNYDDLDSTQGDEDVTAPPDEAEITREVEVPYAT